MKKRWTAMKSIIESYGKHDDIFLSLIDQEGTILCANANMVKSLQLRNPRDLKTNFNDLLHPIHLEEFRKAIHHCGENQSSYSTELHLKNGYFHPMKWQFTPISDTASWDHTFLCVGHKLLDDHRLQEFNRMGEKNYQLIVEGLNAGILFQDRKGELISANAKTADIFGLTLEKLYQLSDFETLWNNDWQVFSEEGRKIVFHETPFMKALSTGKPQNETLRIRLSNGTDRWLYFSSQPLKDEASNNSYSVISNIVDLTKERKLSSDLKEREAMFRAFMNQTPSLAWVVDEDSRLIFASKAFFRYFRLDENSSINKNILELIPRDVGDAMHEKHIQVLNTGIPIQRVDKVQWADGTSFVFHINIFPIEGLENKKLLGGHAVNLADKYKAEKQLQQANDRLQHFTRASSDAIWEWDMQTGHIFRNDALMNMIGYNPEDPKGLSWWLRRIHPEDRNRVSDNVRDASEKNLHSWQDEYRFKCADGEYKHIYDKGYIVYENGLPVKMIGSLQDVSEVKQLQGELVEEKLQRQKEISETVIRVQEKERNRIGLELHDNVNQILSTTKLFVEMLTTSTKDQKDVKKKSLEYIMMAIEEIRKLSKELVVPQLKGDGLVGSIKDLINDIHFGNAMRIKFTHDQENDLLSSGKKVTLFRIVQEQFKNILKHSQAKKVEVFLQCKDNNAELIIRDDGIGFNPEQTARGIGLANIYERTRFYNGKVDIQTAPGKGCILTISIPAND